MGPGSTPNTGPLPGSRFSQLRPEDRIALCTWLDAVRGFGIDDVQDLSGRSWGEFRADYVIGVFKSGEIVASWLIVGHRNAWAVASWPDGAVSAYATISAALGSLYPFPTALIPCRTQAPMG